MKLHMCSSLEKQLIIIREPATAIIYIQFEIHQKRLDLDIRRHKTHSEFEV